MPIIPRANCSKAQLWILGFRKAGASESRDHRRKTQRGPYSAGVHIFHALIDVVATGSHEIEARRLHGIFRRRASDHGIRAHVGNDAVFEKPRLGTRLGFDNARGSISQVGRKPTFESIPWLHDVVIYGDNHILRCSRFRFRKKGNGVIASFADAQCEVF